MKLPPVNLLATILYSVCASLAAEKAANAKDDALAVFPAPTRRHLRRRERKLG